MNYEQKYKEALDKARDMMSYKEVRREDMEYLFPELKENEDEEIKKWIINELKVKHHSLNESNVDFVDKAIAWLEKQREQKSVEWHREDEQNLNACLGYIPDELLRRWLKDVIHIKYDKPIDKVESKFHEGDFIKHNKANCICKIISVNSGSYCVENIETSCRIELFYAEQYFHLWTIEDARDGDVLCTYECDEPKIIFILKGTVKKHRALRYYCYYNLMYPYFEPDSETGCLAPNEEDVKPATKEQRDTLFAKIKESGHECDADKKELIKL